MTDLTYQLSRADGSLSEPRDYFDLLKPHFSNEQIVALTMQVAMINFWNRMAVSMRSQHPVDRAKAA